MEDPIKMDALGGKPLSSETPTCLDRLPIKEGLANQQNKFIRSTT